LAFLTLVRVDGVDLFYVADSTVGALGLAGCASLAEVGKNFVGHGDLHKVRVRFDVIGASGDQYFAAATLKQEI
jgi:hypothetical protein